MSNQCLAIITARGGSKRIPGKNIKSFCGKPIICYSIEAALASQVFDEVMVSTDDPRIAQIAQEAGASVPFLRSAKTADDYASTDDVIGEVLSSYAALGREFSRFCCIYPTAPFLTGARLQEAMLALNHADSCMPIVAFSYPPQRGLILDNGYVCRKYPTYVTTRSQDLEPLYHDCGQFYACRTAAFLAAGTTDVARLVPIILSPKEVQDIDTLEDWELAELKYKLLQAQERK